MTDAERRRLNRALYALWEAEFYLRRCSGVEADGIRAVLLQMIARCKALAGDKTGEERN